MDRNGRVRSEFNRYLEGNVQTFESPTSRQSIPRSRDFRKTNVMSAQGQLMFGHAAQTFWRDEDLGHWPYPQVTQFCRTSVASSWAPLGQISGPTFPWPHLISPTDDNTALVMIEARENPSRFTFPPIPRRSPPRRREWEQPLPRDRHCSTTGQNHVHGQALVDTRVKPDAHHEDVLRPKRFT